MREIEKGVTLTRGQVKRALEWEAWLAHPRSKRPKVMPSCVTCGELPNRMMSRGEPGYPCRHEPLRIDDATMTRARETFGR